MATNMLFVLLQAPGRTSIRSGDSGMFVLVILGILILTVGVRYLIRYRQQIRMMIDNYLKQYYNMLSREE